MRTTASPPHPSRPSRPTRASRPAPNVRQRLDHLVQSDPHAAIVEATQLLRAMPDDQRLALHVWAAIGRSLYELGDMHGAADAMRHALRAAEPGAPVEPDDQLAGVRLSAAIVFAEAGHLTEALDQLVQAEQISVGATLGRVRTQRALILCHAGRLVDALAQADLAEGDLRRSGDRLGQLRLMVNRSLIRLQLGDLTAAEAELKRAHRSALRLEQTVTAALVIANLGVVHARAGRTLVALQHFDRAAAEYEAAGRPLRTMAILEMDRAETLLRAGLFGDAISAAERSVAHSRASGNQVSVGDAQLLLARAHLADDHLDAARRAADIAAQLLHVGGRSGIAVQARSIGLQAILAGASEPLTAARVLRRAHRMADRLDRYGWSDMADDVRIARLRCASRLGLVHHVQDDLTSLRRLVRSRRPYVAIRGWYADSVARSHAGDHVGALRSARTGMELVERHRDAAGSFEHRAGWSAIGADLADLAMRLAVDTRRPATIFLWAERTRDHAFRPEVLEVGPVRSALTLPVIEQQLSGRTMVEYVVVGSRVSAVVLGRGRPQHVELGDLGEVSRVSDHLQTWLHRAALARGADELGQVAQLASRLDELLVAPLGLRPDDDPIIVPVGRLHGVPWACVPGLVPLGFSVSGSAEAWRECDRRAAAFVLRPDPGSVALVVGPGVAGEHLERAAISSVHPGAVVVRGSRATSVRVRTLLSTCDVVHLAAHGTFRSDQPLRSSIQLFDEDMSLYQLAGVDVAGGLVVLSSCEGGAHGAGGANEALGLGSLLVSRGAAAVVAPIAVVSDVACAELVADLHRAWRNGESIGRALASVRRAWFEHPTAARWGTAASFLCLGSGALTTGG